MKAIRCHSFGLPSSLSLDELPTPEVGPGEVLVKVKACSVNFPDLLIIQGKYQVKPNFPFSPGSDLGGIVMAKGEGVSHVKEGDKVIGILPYGGYAEEVIIPAALCFPLPSSMDFITAVAFLMAYSTALHALKNRAGLQRGETLCVLGASGGVGLAAVELGKLMGAKVIAAASNEEKLQLCKAYEADMLINYEDEELKERLKEITNDKGVDVVFDPVGGNYTEKALRACNWGGRYLVVGFAAGEIPRISMNLPLLKGCQIMGINWGRFSMYETQASMLNTMQLVQWHGEGMLKPYIQETFSLKDAPKALEKIMRRETMGKLVIDMTL